MSKRLWEAVLIIALFVCICTGTIGYRIGYREGSKLWEELESQNKENIVNIQQ